MYDLRVEVVEVLGFCDQPMHVGDYFELQGGRIVIPDGKYFCMWAMQSVLPLLPVKQRRSGESNDWMQHTTQVSCPDPNGRVIMEIRRVGAGAETDRAGQIGRELNPAGPSTLGADRQTPPDRMLVSEDVCTGCMRCELACSFGKTGAYSRTDSRIRLFKDDVNQVDRPLVCRQCGNARCVASCPQGALTRHSETHAVLVNREACTGCGTCATACPFDSIRYDAEGFPLICDLCDGEPECVGACPTGAISYGLAGGLDKNPVARAMFGLETNGGDSS